MSKQLLIWVLAFCIMDIASNIYYFWRGRHIECKITTIVDQDGNNAVIGIGPMK